MSGLSPSSVDGMFEPAGRAERDPEFLKAGPVLPRGFLLDTIRSDGVPVKSRRSL